MHAPRPVSITLSLLLSLLVAVTTLGFHAAAHADVSKKVAATFSGQLVVTRGDVDLDSDDKAAIAALKAARLTEVVGARTADDVQAWSFSYIAFLKKTGSTSINVEFLVDNKLVANRRLEGVDPKSNVLQGELAISEDDGPSKGKTYTVNVVAVIKGKEITVATTKLALK